MLIRCWWNSVGNKWMDDTRATCPTDRANIFLGFCISCGCHDWIVIEIQWAVVAGSTDQSIFWDTEHLSLLIELNTNEKWGFAGDSRSIELLFTGRENDNRAPNGCWIYRRITIGCGPTNNSHITTTTKPYDRTHHCKTMTTKNLKVISYSSFDVLVFSWRIRDNFIWFISMDREKIPLLVAGVSSISTKLRNIFDRFAILRCDRMTSSYSTDSAGLREAT